MQRKEDILAIVKQLSEANESATKLIGDLAVNQERLLRRSIVAELALKRIVSTLNPNLSSQKRQQEFERILRETEDDRSSILAAMRQEQMEDSDDGAIDSLRWS